MDIPNGGRIKDGSEKMKFSPSGPPSGSGEHRYVFLIFGHNSKIGGRRTSQIKERKGFQIQRFATENSLGDPRFINFYRSESE